MRPDLPRSCSSNDMPLRVSGTHVAGMAYFSTGERKRGGGGGSEGEGGVVGGGGGS